MPDVQVEGRLTKANDWAVQNLVPGAKDKMCGRERIELRGKDSEGERIADMLEFSEDIRAPVRVPRLCVIAHGRSETSNEDWLL